MRKINISYHKTKIGEFIIGTFDGKLCIADFRYRKLRARLDAKIKTLLSSDFI